MLKVWFYSLISVFITSIIALIGIFTLLIKEKILKKILLFLVSFAAGALFGGAFLHLIPHVVEEVGCITVVPLFILSGILTFFILEKFICWRHCHIPTSKRHPHPVGIMNLVGDGFHNLIDGMIIGGSYLASIPLGISTTMAVILHEIPQEIGDFGILLHAGFSKLKALMFNFISALIAVFGVIFSLLIGTKIHNYSLFLIPFTAGGFIYIAGSDLIPELHKETKPLKSFIQLLALILGIVVMLIMVLVE